MNYIKIEPSEQLTGKKHLLNYQLSLLEVIKRYSAYKKLLSLELGEKKELKKQVSALKEQLKETLTMLPKPSEYSETSSRSENNEGKINAQKKQSLEQEIALIKHKLEMLS